MKKQRLSQAVALALSSGMLSLVNLNDASAATTMYNVYNNFGTTACSPCIGPANPAGGFTDGWVWGQPAPPTFAGPAGGPANAATPGWVGTSGATTTPFGAYVSAPSLNWGFHLTSATDSGQISNADALARYNVSADIDTAAGAWFDNAGSNGTGWLHDLDLGLFRSDVNTSVRLNVSGVNFADSNFGITVFKGMSSNTAGYVHHGGWNSAQNGLNVAPGLGFTASDVVATTDTSGATPINLNELVFNAEAGQIYTIALGGWKDGAWFNTRDGYRVDVAAVPIPAAVWLLISGLSGMGLLNRKPRRV